MVEQIYGVCVVSGLSLTGIILGNKLLDRFEAAFLSRRLVSIIGGVAYLAAVLLLDKHIALITIGTITALVILLRLGFRNWLRGALRNPSARDYSEITYLVAGILSLSIGWGVFDDKWLAFLPVAFIAWGDNAAGLARDKICKGRQSRLWPSLVMLVTCTGIAFIYHPFWIGVVGAVTATIAERFRINTIRFWDDNINVVVFSLAVMVIVVKLTGEI